MKKRFQLQCTHSPNDIQIDAHVIMNDFVPHSYDFGPGDVLVDLLESRRHLSGCLSKHLNEVSENDLKVLVGVELRTGLSLNSYKCLVASVEHVPDVDEIISGHTEQVLPGG